MVVKVVFIVILVVAGVMGFFFLWGAVVICGVIILSSVGYIADRLWVWWRMKREGRFLSRKMAAERIAESGGTIIVESPTIGWGTTRAWWTPDDILDLSPTVPIDVTKRDREAWLNDPDRREMTNDPFIDWCNDPFIDWCNVRYTDLDSGKAYLLATGGGYRLANRLTRRFSGLKMVMLWSGAIDAREFLPKEEGDS